MAPMGAGMLVLAAMAGLALFLIRRRGAEPDLEQAVVPPPWIPPSVKREMSAREAMIEAELQEMISEERAKRVLAPRPSAGLVGDHVVDPATAGTDPGEGLPREHLAHPVR